MDLQLPQASEPARPLISLSPRENQAFTLLVEGTRAKEIGARLGLRAKTIDTHRVNLMRKLDIYNIAGLVRFAMQRDQLRGVELPAQLIIPPKLAG